MLNHERIEKTILTFRGLALLNPWLIATRQLFANGLYNFYNKPEYTPKQLSREEYEIVSNWLSNYAVALGFILEGELDSIKQGQRIQTNTEGKVTTVQALIKNSHQMRGLMHGGLDPAHGGHIQSLKLLNDNSQQVVVGFDSDKDLRFRKGSNSPRYPLWFRMHQVAAMPVVDKVIPIPSINTKNPADYYLKLYQELGIKVLVCDPTNVYLQQYQDHMAQLGGRVITKNRERLLMSEVSSTNVESVLASSNPFFISKKEMDQIVRDFLKGKRI